MKPREIDLIIIRLIENNISEEESVFLIKWLEDKKNKSYFDEFIEINYLINAKNSFDYKSSLQKLKEFMNRKSRKKRWPLLKYAAVFVAFVGITYFFVKQSNNTIDTELHIKNEEITLELDNGDIMVIPNLVKKNIRNNKGNLVTVQQGNKLNYQIKSTREKLVYNKLTIPYGKTFQVILSDGTLIHLNAGSTLRYPVKFIQGDDRMVFVEGEAYFKVAKDLKHPFIVNANDINIRVTGTEFNVSCYKEDININTVLASGSIRLYGKNELYNMESSIGIVPGELAAWHKTEKKIAVSKVNIAAYTAWREGVLIFKHLKFKDIITRLERHYNVTIVNNNQKLNDEIFTARFENNSVEHVMESFKDIYAIDYTIANNQIIINNLKSGKPM